MKVRFLPSPLPLIFLLVVSTVSANLVGIEPGTNFAPSQSHTTYVLWDVTMNRLTITNQTIILENHTFHIEPIGGGRPTIDINHWRPPDIDLKIDGYRLNINIGGYIPHKHYRLNINNQYHSIQANQTGQLLYETTTQCRTLTTTGEYDINLDGEVNNLEVSMIVAHYKENGAPGWIPSDINDDGTINYLEVSIIATHYNSPL